MDLKTRADLVRACRFEIKQARLTGRHDYETRDPDGVDTVRRPRGRGLSFRPIASTSRQRMEVARTRSRFERPRRGEDADSYINRTAEGGDSSYGNAAARWDLRRPRGTARATPWDDGYTSYGGNPRPYVRSTMREREHYRRSDARAKLGRR